MEDKDLGGDCVSAAVSAVIAAISVGSTSVPPRRLLRPTRLCPWMNRLW